MRLDGHPAAQGGSHRSWRGTDRYGAVPRPAHAGGHPAVTHQPDHTILLPATGPLPLMGRSGADRLLQQPPGQGATAAHLQLAPLLGLQLTDGRRKITAENGRVLPTRRDERGRSTTTTWRTRPGVSSQVLTPGTRSVSPKTLSWSMRSGLRRQRSGSLATRCRGHSQRCDDAQEPPPALVVAEGREVLELEVLEEEQAHRVHGKHVDRKRNPFDGARRSVAVGVATKDGDVSFVSSRAVVGCRPAFACAVSQGPSFVKRRLWP